MLTFSIGYWLRSAIPVEGYLGWALWLLSLESIWMTGDRRIRIRILGFTLSVELINTNLHKNTAETTVKATLAGKIGPNGEEIDAEMPTKLADWAREIHSKGIRMVMKSRDIYDTTDNSFTLVVPPETPLPIEIGTKIAFGGPEDALFVHVAGYRAMENDVVRYFGKVIKLS